MTGLAIPALREKGGRFRGLGRGGERLCGGLGQASDAIVLGWRWKCDGGGMVRVATVRRVCEDGAEANVTGPSACVVYSAGGLGILRLGYIRVMAVSVGQPITDRLDFSAST